MSKRTTPRQPLLQREASQHIFIICMLCVPKWGNFCNFLVSFRLLLLRRYESVEQNAERRRRHRCESHASSSLSSSGRRFTFHRFSFFLFSCKRIVGFKARVFRFKRSASFFEFSVLFDRARDVVATERRRRVDGFYCSGEEGVLGRVVRDAVRVERYSRVDERGRFVW